MEHTPQSHGDRPVNSDYLVLSCLEKHDGKATFDELKTTVCDVVDRLEEEGIDPPIHYIPTNGPKDVYSKSLIRAISRCTDSQSINENNSTITMTPAGESFLKEMHQFSVSQEFMNAVDAGLRNEQLN